MKDEGGRMKKTRRAFASSFILRLHPYLRPLTLTLSRKGRGD